MLGSSRTYAQLIQTVAGNGSPGYGGDGATASTSTVNGPFGLAVDKQGNLYIADTNNSRIRVVNRGSTPVTIANVTIAPGNIATVAGNGNPGFTGDGGQATNAQIHNPSSVAVDNAGNIYFVDLYNYRVRKVDTTGVITTIVGTGGSSYSGNGLATAASLSPNGVAVDKNGNVYIADTYNNAIRTVNMGSSPITIANVTIQPGYIATVAGNGIFGSTGDGGPALNAEFSNPYGVAVDNAGNVYICDTYNRRIRVVNSGATPITIANVTIQPGTVQTIAGDGTYGHKDGVIATSAEFADPDGVAVDTAGNIYIADLENYAIHLINNSTGLIITIAGTGVYGYNGDNIPAKGAYLAYTRQLCVDSAGNVYFADEPNQRIREVPVNTITRAISSSATEGFIVGTPSSFAITANYWPTPALSISGTLPSGITFTDNRNGTATLAGTPGGNTAGTYNLTVTANNGLFANVIQNLTLTVYASGAAPISSAAIFVSIDTQTKGNWQSIYGSDGYSLANAGQFIPAYASFAIRDQQNYTWDFPSDFRALQLPGSSQRIAATWYNSASSTFNFDLNWTDGQSHLVSLYALDYDYRGRVETIQILDASSGFTLYSLPLATFYNGIYLTFSVTGHVQIVATSINGPNATLSAIFFGGNGSSPTVPAITLQPANTIVNVGSQGSFTVGATGGGLAYQWQSRPPGAGSFSDIQGGTSASYTTPATSFSDSGTQFRCVVTNSLGSATSAAATLTVATLITVTVSPSTSTLYQNQHQSFTATLQNTADQRVTWAISPANAGSIASDGTYTAPASIPALQTVTVTATSVADSTKSGTASITLSPAVSVSINPTFVALSAGQTKQFSVTVLNTSDTSVTWTISPPGAGTLVNGLYTVPASILTNQTITVTATSNFDNSKSASARITLSSVPLTPPNGLVLWWTFDSANTFGTTIVDSSGTGGSGTILGSPTVIPGLINQALNFNGTNSFVSMPEAFDPPTSFLGSITLSAWIKTSNASRLESIISKYDAVGGGWGYIFRTDANGFLEMFFGSNDAQSATLTAIDTTKVNDGQWHHATAVVTIGQDVKFYVDGRFSSATTIKTIPNGDNFSNLNVGLNSWAPFGSYFTGSIDEVRVYNLALTASQVNTLYLLSGGTPDITPPSISISAPGNNAPVSGNVTITSIASDNIAVAGVQFQIDGTNLGSAVATPPFSKTWDSTGAANGQHTISAIATDTSGNSAIASVTVTVSNPAATPAFNPPAGVYSGTQMVSITTTTPNATIRYTTDGSNPTETSGIVYSGPITISATTVLNAIAYANGVADSSIALATYTITSNAAQFVKSDTTTQGNWQATYGADGFNIINDTVKYPSYATVTPSGQSSYSWASSTSDARALQKFSIVGDRIAATWYSATNFTVDVNLTDGITHQVALYFVDWDNQGRKERIDILDAQTGTVLDTRTISSFSSTPQYLAWNLKGHLVLKVTSTGALNAVLSGVFFGGGASGGGATSTAQFLNSDTSTKGNWQGVYGADGFNIISDTVNDPPYANVTANGQLTYTWASSTSDTRGLRKFSNPSDRIAATWYSSTTFNVDVNLTDGNAHPVALYFVDWDNQGRSERIDVLDALTGIVLDTRTVSSFSSTPQYLVWNLKGHLVLKITSTGPLNAVLSGLFFGGGGSGTTNTALFVKTDTSTLGNWQGVYGADGFNVINDTSHYPSYASVTPAGQLSWTWTSSTNDTRALQKSSNPSDRIAATWYSGTTFSVDVNLTDGSSHQVALYFLDWDNQSRSERIDVLDAQTGIVLDTRTVSSFSTIPQYLVWNLKGHVILKFTSIGGLNAVASGLFFQ